MIVGLLLVIYPMVSSAFLSIIIGFSLVCFGMAAVCMGFVFTEDSTYSLLSIIVGITSLILGMIFMFFLNALPFLVSLQFYIVGFLMIFYGILGIIYLDDKSYIALSVIGLILGILNIVLAVFAASAVLNSSNYWSSVDCRWCSCYGCRQQQVIN